MSRRVSGRSSCFSLGDVGGYDLNVLPWWTKVAAKVVLARLPVGYNWWRKLGVFRHGEMLNPDYAINVFDRHYERVKAFLPKNYTVLELGPGDSLATAIIASARGAAQVYLVDAGSFAATKDMTRYNALAQRLAQNGTPVSGAPFKTIQDMLRETNAIYLTEGINSLRVLPELSIDFIFSQAVLEHIALSEFQETMHSLFRLLRHGGISSHRVDLQDHLATHYTPYVSQEQHGSQGLWRTQDSTPIACVQVKSSTSSKQWDTK